MQLASDSTMRKARICILTNYPVDHRSFSGGVETATDGLLAGLRAYQHEYDFHLIAASNVIPKDIHQQQDGFHYHFLAMPQLAVARPRFFFRVFKAYRLLRRLQPDLVHCQDNLALAAAAICSGYRRVLTIHGIKKAEAGKRIGWERWAATADAWLEPYVQRAFPNLVCLSVYSQSFLDGARRIYRIPNAVRPAFYPLERQSLNHPVFLFVGKLSPLKGPEELIIAHQMLCRQHPALETVFCGAPETPAYQQYLRGRAGADRIHFLGPASLDELKHWLSVATALVLPSRQENAPIIIAEALACGLPVVATRVGGIAEMLDDGRLGFLYDPGDVSQLTSHLETLLRHPAAAHPATAAGRLKAQTVYHPAAVAGQTVAMYRELLSGIST